MSAPRGDPAAVFLSVVVRTVGDRNESLRDALVCLAAQTDDDFEIDLIVHHPNSPDAASTVRALVAEEVPSLAARTRVVPCVGGGRSRPLNVGLDGARGEYVAFLDDDDLVLAHWVSVFHEASRVAPGRAVRSVVADQRCVPEGAPLATAVAVGPLELSARTRFSLLEHVAGRASPLHAFCFPRRELAAAGVRVNEKLDVLEDWEFELRVARAVGVYSVETVTGIFRRQPSGDVRSQRAATDVDAIMSSALAAIDAGDVFTVDGAEVLEFRTMRGELIRTVAERNKLRRERDAVREERDTLFHDKESEIADKQAALAALGRLGRPGAALRQLIHVLRVRNRTPSESHGGRSA